MDCSSGQWQQAVVSTEPSPCIFLQQANRAPFLPAEPMPVILDIAIANSRQRCRSLAGSMQSETPGACSSASYALLDAQVALILVWKSLNGYLCVHASSHLRQRRHRRCMRTPLLQARQLDRQLSLQHLGAALAPSPPHRMSLRMRHSHSRPTHAVRPSARPPPAHTPQRSRPVFSWRRPCAPHRCSSAACPIECRRRARSAIPAAALSRCPTPTAPGRPAAVSAGQGGGGGLGVRCGGS